MSQIKVEYQKQMDAFCDKNNKTTAQDILKKTQNIPVDEEKFAKFNVKRRSSMVWRAALPMVLCFLLLGTTTLAATGRLSTFFRSIFKDEKTAEIVEQGYVYETNCILTDKDFKVNIIGITGDIEHPIIAMDFYVIMLLSTFRIKVKPYRNKNWQHYLISFSVLMMHALPIQGARD